MLYLLDTHIFLWFMEESPQIPYGTRKIIEDSDDICISIISFWEMAIKNSLGKLPLPCSIAESMRICEEELGFSILAIKDTHLETLRALPWIHKDPFDRLIISQAIAEDMALISVDEHIAGYPVRRIWEC